MLIETKAGISDKLRSLRSTDVSFIASHLDSHAGGVEGGRGDAIHVTKSKRKESFIFDIHPHSSCF